jgi:hypothetical protein
MFSFQSLALKAVSAGGLVDKVDNTSKIIKRDRFVLSMWISTFLRDQRDHFRITIYKKDRENWGISIGDIVLIQVNEEKLVRPILKDYQITIPKRLVNFDDKIKVRILKSISKKEGLKRPRHMFNRGRIDIKYFIPKRTIYGKDIFVFDIKDRIIIWYPTGGGVGHVSLKRHITDCHRLIEVLGFFFGDGSTEGVRSVRFTNCEPSTLQKSIEVFKNIGVPVNRWKVQVLYSGPSKILKGREFLLKNFWQKQLGVPRENIKSILYSKSKHDSTKSSSARIFIDNAILSELLINGLLPKIIPLIKNPKNEEELVLAKDFLRGVLAAEGSVQLVKGSLRRLTLSFDPNSEERNIFKALLLNAGVSKIGEYTNRNELDVRGWDNFKIFHKEELFKLHDRMNNLFNSGFKNHKYNNIRV